MKYFLLLSLFLYSFNSHSAVRFFTANKRIRTCSPANSSSAGTMISTNFGRLFGLCGGFGCQSGYEVSGDQCVASAPSFNVVCTTSVLGSTTLKPCQSNMSFGATFSAYRNSGSCTAYGGSTGTETNSTFNMKLYCSNTGFTAFTQKTGITLGTCSILFAPQVYAGFSGDYLSYDEMKSTYGCVDVP